MPHIDGCLVRFETHAPQRPYATRRLAGLALLAAAALALPSGSVEAAPLHLTVAPARSDVGRIAVFGRDDRVKTPPERAAVSEKIGVIVDLDRNTVCTAFCVGTHTVMTAAHCIYPASGPGGARLDAIRYRPTLQTVNSDARVAGRGGRASNQSVLAGSTRLSLHPPIDAVSDWIMIRLDRNVCSKGGLEISRRSTEDLHQLAREKRIYNIAFHSDFENFTRALSAPCGAPRSFDGATWETISRDFRNADDLLLHTCDTGGSSSGSPLLIDGPDGPEVIGINVGTYLHSTGADGARERQSASAAPSPSREIANTAIAAHTLADVAKAFTGNELIGTSGKIRELQARLQAAGDFAGPVDGIQTARFKAAIRQAEARLGLPITGLPTRRLLRRLN